ncbi:unnamed protein product [Durusdinium trenchii]|uniref:Fibronectin type-III domain-containing protein n=1 Tax=Durusdinium trenchii TaxID=1381693 RepID=A0ABP0SZ10_9DINO
MASLPQLVRERELSAPPTRGKARDAQTVRSKSFDANRRLPAVASGKEVQGPSHTPRDLPSGSKLRPHPSFQAYEPSEEDLEVAWRARPAATPEDCRKEVVLLEFFGIAAQEVLSTFHVQFTEVREGDLKPKAAAASRATFNSFDALDLTNAVGRSSSKTSQASTPRTPREAKGREKALNSLKRSASGCSDRSESDGWVNAICWAVPVRRNSMRGPVCSALLAAVVVPMEPGGACQKQCRLLYKSKDWVKWGLAVRKDPPNWLGQVSMPILLGLEKPVVMCSLVRSGSDGLSHKLVLHWSVREASNKILLCLGSLLWQYRWRWCHAEDANAWSLGPIKKTSALEWGSYCSAPLIGDWTPATGGAVEISLRYKGNSIEFPNSSATRQHLSLSCCAWSDWSDSTGPTELKISPPRPQEEDLKVCMDDHNPCKASLTWHAFVAEVGYSLDYRVLLKCDDRVREDWELVGWWEGDAGRAEAFVQALSDLKPSQTYSVRVEARYAGGGGWSEGLMTSFQTLHTWHDLEPLLSAPELLPHPDVTKRAVLLPDKNVELEWAAPGQRWEKLSFTTMDGIASFDVVKLQYRLGKEADAWVRWTSHGIPGEIAWLSTGLEVPTITSAELQPSNGVELCFANREAADCYQIRCQEPSGHFANLDPKVLGREEEVKAVLGPTKVSGRSFCVRLGCDGGFWSQWSPCSTVTARPRPGPRPESLHASSPGSAVFVPDGYGPGFGAIVTETAKGTTMKLSWEGFASHGQPIGYHLKLSPGAEATEEFFEARRCTVSTHLGLQQCEVLLNQLMPNTEYSATVYVDGGRDDKAQISTTFRTGSWNSDMLRPLMPPRRMRGLERGDALRNVSFQKSQILLDPRMSLKGPGDLYVYELQWRHVNGLWTAVRSLILSQEPEAEMVQAEWMMASDLDGFQDFEQVELRMALKDPVARVFFPECLWLSEASAPMTIGFKAPGEVTAKLTWSNAELFIEVPLCEWTQELFDEKKVTHCQVKFQGHPVGGSAVTSRPVRFCSEAMDVSELHYLDRRSPVTVLLPILSLPFEANFAYVASLRIGDDQLWSDWGDFGNRSTAVVTSLPHIWSKDGEIVATTPVNCKAKLDWAQLCCSLGAVPLEVVISLATSETSSLSSSAQTGGQCCERSRERLVAMTSCTSCPSDKLPRGPSGPSLRDRLEVAVNGFDPGTAYQFILYARAQLPVLGGMREGESLLTLGFTEVARSKHFQWPSRLSEEWSCIVDWSLPLPLQVLIPDEELESSSQRWHGRAVLLSWPSGALQLEVREETQNVHQVFGWQSCRMIHIRLFGVDYAAACELPSDLVRFRWRREAAAAPGPCSDVCVARVAVPKVTAELVAPGVSGPGRLRVRLRVEGGSEAVLCRIRYRDVQGEQGEQGDERSWKFLAPRPVSSAKFTVEVGEDHLKQDTSCVFSVQLLSRCRRSQWSPETSPIEIKSPKLEENPGMLSITARNSTSVTISWELQQLQASMTVAQSLQLEFRLDLFKISEEAPPEHRTSILIEGEGNKQPACEAKVFNLWPATEYSAELFARCVRPWTRRWQPTGLKSHFITPV